MALQILLGLSRQEILTDLRKTALPQKSPSGEKVHNLMNLQTPKLTHLGLVLKQWTKEKERRSCRNNWKVKQELMRWVKRHKLKEL